MSAKDTAQQALDEAFKDMIKQVIITYRDALISGTADAEAKRDRGVKMAMQARNGMIDSINKL